MPGVALSAEGLQQAQQGEACRRSSQDLAAAGSKRVHPASSASLGVGYAWPAPQQQPSRRSDEWPPPQPPRRRSDDWVLAVPPPTFQQAGPAAAPSAPLPPPRGVPGPAAAAFLLPSTRPGVHPRFHPEATTSAAERLAAHPHPVGEAVGLGSQRLLVQTGLPHIQLSAVPLGGVAPCSVRPMTPATPAIEPAGAPLDSPAASFRRTGAIVTTGDTHLPWTPRNGASKRRNSGP